MDTATMRRRGSTGTLSRTVCVTSIRTRRSGVLGNGHAPCWNSGRRSDPPLDCNKLSDSINPPQVGILGVGRVVEKPAVYQGEIAKRSMLFLSLTFDHRVIDDAPAAAFVRAVAGH